MIKKCYYLTLVVILLFTSAPVAGEDGYRLWLRYDKTADPARLKEYQDALRYLLTTSESPTLSVVKKELTLAIGGFTGNALADTKTVSRGTLVAGTLSSPLIQGLHWEAELKALGSEGYIIRTASLQGKRCIVIAAREDVGVLYGAFHFIRLMQTLQPLTHLDISSHPRIKHRILNHWDNLDGTVERGYAGFSLWDWHKLPDYIDTRYHDYARANASIGINGTVLTNVNANALILTPQYLEKVAALADVFRPYGIKVYLTARFSAPVEIGGLPTADPLNDQVKAWWINKAKEIYEYIPDFGGFTVKANSEGQPGPQNYNRTHADGANLLAEAVAPYGGIVMWRAFVYDNEVPVDRVKQAYDEFKPLDGSFHKNVLVQVKNGPLDFQPREPFHPLFGAMPATPLMMEFQLTQEYLGFATHLVYLPTLFKECLDADTYAKGPGSTVAKVIDGSLENHTLSGIAGVANIGTDRNWTGHPFGQANWYAFGRLAWNPSLPAETIATEWIRQTFTTHRETVQTIQQMMMASREITVQYMTPLGLHHIMGWSHHYGPAPWIKNKQRADWTSVYYHRADSLGVGFDRTITGSHALEQYTPPVQHRFNSVERCPDEYLLWFHHLPWTHKMKSGRTLWDELCYAYHQGADSVKWMQQQWLSVKDQIDDQRFQQVASLLAIQQKEAVWWRNACVLYFQRFSAMAIPEELEKPDKPLSYYEGLEFPFAPGIRPKW